MARAKFSGKRRNKTKFKWTKELIFFLIGIVVVIGIMIYCLIPTSERSFYTKWNNGSNNIQLDNQFKEISYDGLKKKIENKELVYVYYALDTEDESKTNLGILDHYTNTHKGTNENTHYNVGTVYVYDATEAANLDSDNSEQVAKLDQKEDYFNSIKNASIKKDIDLEKYSQLWVFENGQLVFSSQDIIADSQATSQGANFTLAAVKFLGFKLTDEDVTK